MIMHTLDFLYLQMILEPTYKSVTAFTKIDRTMTLTRRGKPRKSARSVHFILTVGKPNYSNSKWIKKNPNLTYRVIKYK